MVIKGTELRDTCCNSTLFSPFYFPFPLFLSGFISLERVLYPGTDLGIHRSPSSWRTQPWARGILWNHSSSAHSQPGSTGAAPLFHGLNVRQSSSVTAPKFQGTQTSCPALSQLSKPCYSMGLQSDTIQNSNLFLPALISHSPHCLPKPNSQNTLFIKFPSLRGSGIASLVSSADLIFLARLSSQVCCLRLENSALQKC